jgi:hypothetical protein
VAATHEVAAPDGASAHVKGTLANYNKLVLGIVAGDKHTDDTLREAMREAAKGEGIAALGAVYVPYAPGQACDAVLAPLKTAVIKMATSKATAAKTKGLSAALLSLLALVPDDGGAAAKAAADSARMTGAQLQRQRRTPPRRLPQRPRRRPRRRPPTRWRCGRPASGPPWPCWCPPTRRWA